MVVPSLCLTVSAALRQVETTVVLEQLGSTLFDTALLMVVKDRSANASYPGSHLSREESEQKAMSDFYMTFNLILRLTPILPSLLLARLGDRGWRKVPIVVPLCGYLLARLGLLLVVVLRLPLQVMFGAAVLYELCGGYCSFWPGVITLTSIGTTAKDRSKVSVLPLILELLYGLAGLVGSLVSGHLFLLYSSSLGNGTILLIVSILLHLLSLLHSIVLLQVSVHVRKVSSGSNRELECCPILDVDAPEEVPAKINMPNVVLLFVAAILYNSAVGGAVELLGVFVMKEPLSWTATQVGYGNAAGCMIFITSFLGLMVFRRCINDVMLVLVGMVSFATGIYFMSFVTKTYLFYLARSLNLFALIPMPTIRSLLSKQVPASSCGITLTSLQLSLKFAGLVYIPTFTKLYQRTLDWLPGFVFLLSSILTVLGMIPVRWAAAALILCFHFIWIHNYFSMEKFQKASIIS
uniref:Uncharacterized protein n=1 Tax=Mola mola TaxID=94237 RepID=A0A3Q4BZL8_MOLML